MATPDGRIAQLTRKVLAERKLPTGCSAILIHNNPLTEITLGNWAKNRYVSIRFWINSSGSDDTYDENLIASALSDYRF
jgi:hypothetical protein